MSLPKINLVPQPNKRPFLSYLDVYLLLMVMAACGLFFAYGKRLEHRAQTMQSEIVEQDRQISELRLKLPAIATMRRDNLRLMDQIGMIKQLKIDPVRYANLLWELSEIVPASCYISNLDVDPSTRAVTMNGVSTSKGGASPLENVAHLLRNFRNSRYFLDSTLSATTSTVVDGKPAWTFQLSAHYDDQAALKRPEEAQPKH